MGTVTNFLLCSFIVGIAETMVNLEADSPFLKVHVFHTADLKCCYKTAKENVKPSEVKLIWIKQASSKTQDPHPVVLSDRVTQRNRKLSDMSCGTLKFQPVHLNDSGLYRCVLSNYNLASHGTYLHVYKFMDKTINLSESTKNTILTVEGVLLLLCVLLPSATLLLKSKRLNSLEKKKAKKEEENIYQGLNLDDCWSTYDQIERSQAHGPYQDVCNVKEEEEQIQLEKP